MPSPVEKACLAEAWMVVAQACPIQIHGGVVRVSARTSMRLKRIRRRFGIGAPQVTIRSQIPWYGRWAIGLLAIGIVLLVVGLGFGLRIDGGRDAVALHLL